MMSLGYNFKQVQLKVYGQSPILLHEKVSMILTRLSGLSASPRDHRNEQQYEREQVPLVKTQEPFDTHGWFAEGPIRCALLWHMSNCIPSYTFLAFSNDTPNPVLLHSLQPLCLNTTGLKSQHPFNHTICQTISKSFTGQSV